MPKDLTDDRKYKEYGAYHWKVYVSNPNYRKYVDSFISIYMKNEKKQHSVLDIGCGDGLFSAILKARYFQKVQGIDLNSNAITIANNIGLSYCKHLNIYKVTSPYRNAIMLDVFEHLEKPILVIKKLNEILSQRLYLVFPIETDIISPHHVTVYTAKRIISLFKQHSDFNAKEVINFGYINKTLIIFEKNDCPQKI